MPRILRTRQANIDLVETWVFLAEINREVADQWVEAVSQKSQLYAHHPEGILSQTECKLVEKGWA